VTAITAFAVNAIIITADTDGHFLLIGGVFFPQEKFGPGLPWPILSAPIGEG
jgi:hypothetical protein